jgi:hypothetical protein
VFPWFKAFGFVTKSPLTVRLGDVAAPASIDNAFTTLTDLGNDVFDRMFYNVEEIDRNRADKFSGLQGSIIHIPADRNAEPEECADALELFEKYPDVGAITVAGVGSSAIGGVGLARDVADATGLSVAAVVSGSGAFDWIWQG